MRAEDVSPLRDLRLRALADAPAAFAATVDDEGARSEAEWAELAAESESAETAIVFVAAEDEQWLGMAAGRWFDRERGIVALWGMWVAPECRGAGIGARLVIAVREWAASVGARFVRLGVIEGEADAGAFYERLGFVRTGETRSLTRDPSVGAYFLARPV
ncbi:MAG: GNAT family N-acetyltransferase [Solirubrobacteraceae bacterium]